MNADRSGGSSFVLYPGSVQPGVEAPLINPSGRGFHNHLDLIALDAYGTSVDLSAALHAVAAFVPTLEAKLTEQFAGHPTQAGDLVLQLVAVFGDAATGTEYASDPDAALHA